MFYSLLTTDTSHRLPAECSTRFSLRTPPTGYLWNVLLASHYGHLPQVTCGMFYSLLTTDTSHRLPVEYSINFSLRTPPTGYLRNILLASHYGHRPQVTCMIFYWLLSKIFYWLLTKIFHWLLTKIFYWLLTMDTADKLPVGWDSNPSLSCSCRPCRSWTRWLARHYRCCVARR